MTRAELKRKSKEQIQGHIPKLFLCTLASNIILLPIVLLIILNLYINLSNSVLKYNNILTNGIVIFFFILSIIYPAIEYSLSKIFLCVVRKEKFTIREFFKNIFDLSIIKKAFCFSIFNDIYVLIQSLLLEFIMVAFILIPLLPSGTSGLVILFLGIPIFAIIVCVINIQYSMSYYILIDNPNMNAQAVLKESKNIMHGHKFTYIVLQLSFIGWLLLSITTLGLGAIYIMPYYKSTITNFYEYIKHKNSQADII